MKRSTLSIANKGFTLIELLVVIVIIGILISAFAISTAAARENAKIAKATAESRELGNAIRLFCMTQYDTAIDAKHDPMRDLGLSDGLNDAGSSIVNMLTKPNSNNGNTVYYNASDKMIRKNNLCDPWGNPYKIRVKKVLPQDSKTSNDYTIIVPFEGRHRALEPMNVPVGN
ncbi:MAG: prepilin-type N-terminal cleavage/methylation domain-containing protein [Kiritimatiellia bacterium]